MKKSDFKLLLLSNYYTDSQTKPTPRRWACPGLQAAARPKRLRRHDTSQTAVSGVQYYACVIHPWFSSTNRNGVSTSAVSVAAT
jgi:hypothetical protein